MAISVGGPLFGVSLTAPVQRVSSEQLEQMQPVLAAAVERVTKAMRVSAWLGELDVEFGAEAPVRGAVRAGTRRRDGEVNEARLGGGKVP